MYANNKQKNEERERVCGVTSTLPSGTLPITQGSPQKVTFSGRVAHEILLTGTISIATSFNFPIMDFVYLWKC